MTTTHPNTNKLGGSAYNPTHSQAHWQVARATAQIEPAKELASLPTDSTEVRPIANKRSRCTTSFFRKMIVTGYSA